MNKEAHKGADGTNRCSTTHLLRSPSNIICVAAKNFEICAFVHACTGDRIHAKSRVGPYTRRKRRHVEQCNMICCIPTCGCAGTQVCNDCVPATLVLHPRETSSDTSVVYAAGRAAVQCIGGDAKKLCDCA